MNINIKGYNSVEVEENSKAIGLFKIIKPENKNRIVAVKINNILKDLSTELKDSDNVEFIYFDTDEGKNIFWHSSAHIMAQAVLRLFPNTTLAIGPAIKEGFYYDFSSEHTFVPEDLPLIEKEIKKITKENLKLERFIKNREDTILMFKEKNEKYKLELVQDFKDDEFSFYKQGEFTDLCRGPHLPSTGSAKHFKLLSIAGAYWRGDERREMLQRIYAISFPTADELKEFILYREEAKKRDHKKLGKKLNLFEFFPEGPGFPFFKPKGVILWNTIVEFLRKKLYREDYQEVKTPMILNEDLWHRSGHWDHYKENMYFTEIDEKDYAVKPMNCPGCLLVYKSDLHSYKEFPLKYAEFGLVHRHERSGVLNGLFRVRNFTQDDAHVFCLSEQIEEEVSKIIDLIYEVYKNFGFENYSIELSTRPLDSIGSDEIWSKSEAALKNALDNKKIEYEINKGEGAFYGPKIDFHIEDSLKRTWQCGTIQLDFSMPERFELEYIGQDNAKHRPVMIHRAIFGSIERFLGMLIEHYGAAFPLWLAPEQIKIIPVSEHFNDYSKEVYKVLLDNNFRVSIDSRNESLGKKIRESQTMKIPYSLILGQKEVESKTINIRKYGSREQTSIELSEFIKNINKEIKEYL